jgi:hypothetical protein
MEELKKKEFKLSDEELSNPKYRKGWPGQLVFPPGNDHTNGMLSGYYKAGRYVGVRGAHMQYLNNLRQRKK